MTKRSIGNLNTRIVLKIKGSQDWFEELDRKAELANMSRSEFVRWGVHSAFVPARTAEKGPRQKESMISADAAFGDLLGTLAKRAGMTQIDYIQEAVSRAVIPPNRSPQEPAAPVQVKRPVGRPRGNPLARRIQAYENTLRTWHGDAEGRRGLEIELERMRAEWAGEGAESEPEEK